MWSFVCWSVGPGRTLRTEAGSQLLLLFRCEFTAHELRDDLIFLLCVTALGAVLCFLGSLVWYQISPVRPLLYQPCCPPAKQMTAAPRRPPPPLPLWQTTRQPISYPSLIHLALLPRGEIVTRMPLQRTQGEQVVVAAVFWQWHVVTFRAKSARGACDDQRISVKLGFSYSSFLFIWMNFLTMLPNNKWNQMFEFLYISNVEKIIKPWWKISLSPLLLCNLPVWRRWPNQPEVASAELISNQH